MEELTDLLRHAVGIAAAYRSGVGDRPVTASGDSGALRAAFGGPLPRTGTAPRQVIDELAAAAAPG